tara:strand:+ start:897 stop:1121 length:225 start_codon:yes stop_codon:yes gene_type:complete
MRVKSENGVVFAGETKQTSTLSVGSWLLLLGLVFKSADECEQKKAKKTKKAVFFLSFLPLDLCLGGANFVRKED